MISTNSQRIEEVLTRGVEQVLPDYKTLAALMSQRRIRLYLGIDPTAAFLHLGHSVVLRKLQQFAELGHEVILLVGNGTVKIGDPTGRDESRPMLSDEEIEKNFQDWQNQASKILDFSKITIRHNGDWLDALSYSDMVKLLAKTTVQQLLERDMFQKRLAQGLPIFGHEIIYPLLQGYDSVAMDVDLEVGGNDQTFNMMMGRHLLQQYKQKEKWVLATPLIEGTDGRKMSKTYNNYVALTEEANNMYGKLMSVRDELIIKYFTLLTDVSLKEIQEMEQAMQAGENPMNFKKLLALSITKQYHDAAAASAAAENFSRSFQEGQMPDEALFQVLELQWDEQKKLLRNSFCSNSEWQRLLDQGAIKILPEQKKLDKEGLFALADGSKIKVGKKNWFRVHQNKTTV
jgi:tyrosyl-tRNA synthetase